MFAAKNRISWLTNGEAPEGLLKREDAWIGVIFGLLLNLVSNLF